MSSSLKFVVGALAFASVAQAQPTFDPLASLDLSTAEAVPTECTADQLTLIYDSCIAHCQASLPADGIVQCTDISTRFLMVKCATEADKCGKNVQSQVVRQAQSKRLADLCTTLTSFPIAEAKLVFASASEVEQSSSMQEQAVQLMGGSNSSQASSFSQAPVNNAQPAVSRGGLYGSETVTKVPNSRATGDRYQSESMVSNGNETVTKVPNSRVTGDMYQSEPMVSNGNKTSENYPSESINRTRTITRRGGTEERVPEITKRTGGKTFTESPSAGKPGKTVTETPSAGKPGKTVTESPSAGKPGKKEVSEYTWKQHTAENKDVASVNGVKASTGIKNMPAGVATGVATGVNGTVAYKANGNVTGKPNSAIRLAPIASAVLVFVMTAFLL